MKDVKQNAVLGILGFNIIASATLLGVSFFIAHFSSVPDIQEAVEKERLIANYQAYDQSKVFPVYMEFKDMTLNLHPQTDLDVKKMDAGNDNLNTRYLNVSLCLELKSGFSLEKLEPIRTLLIDKIMHVMGKKKFYELATIQGRYMLKAELLQATNEIVLNFLSEKQVLIGVFFSSLILQ